MDRKTQNLIYNVGKTMLQEEGSLTALAQKAGNLAPNPYTDWNAYVKWREAHGNPVSQSADPNSLETIALNQQGRINAAAQGLDKNDPETWGPGDKRGSLGRGQLQSANATPDDGETVAIGPQEATQSLWDRMGSAWDGIGDKWNGLSTPEKFGVAGLVGAPLALGASYLAYKKMKENKK